MTRTTMLLKQELNNDDKKLFVGGIHFNDLSRKVEELKKKKLKQEKKEEYLARQAKKGSAEQRFNARKLQQELFSKAILGSTGMPVAFETEEDLTKIKQMRVQNLIKLISSFGSVTDVKDFVSTKQHMFITFTSSEDCEKV